MADTDTKKYTVTVNVIHGGENTLHRGDAVELTDEQAVSHFWRNRVRVADSVTVATPAATENSGGTATPAAKKTK